MKKETICPICHGEGTITDKGELILSFEKPLFKKSLWMKILDEIREEAARELALEEKKKHEKQKRQPDVLAKILAETGLQSKINNVVKG